MTREQLEEWLRLYGKAWEEQDPTLATSLYTEDVRYQVTPFVDPQVGLKDIHDYTLRAAELQRDVHFDFKVLSYDPAVVHWWTSYVKKVNGEKTRLDGIFLLEFAEDGRCSSLREWWHADPSPSF